MERAAATVGPTIILASTSPRRQAFLRALGLTFAVHAADVDETPLPGELPAQLAGRLASHKAAAAAARLDQSGALIVAADTVVAIDDRLLGKPVDAADARAMLKALRGRDHHVLSSICVMDAGNARQGLRLNDTRVTMRAYSDDEIEAYLDTGDPFDKAGAYAIQHETFRPVARIEGCLSGVMGLPLADLRDLLSEFGVILDTPLPQVCENHGNYACCQRGKVPQEGDN